MKPGLHSRRNAGATIRELEDGTWRLEIPAGGDGVYRWAQLDDHMHCSRSAFSWRAPLRMKLKARVSANDLPGTWGFGFWNDPFSASFGISGTARRLPALPDAVWFFYAGAPNYLAFHDTHPAQGLLAATFSSARIPALLLAPGLMAAPLLFFRPLARLLRKAAGLLIKDDAALITADPIDWHEYRMQWEAGRAQFWVDEASVFSTQISPGGRMGFTIWIDNQFAAFTPDGKLRFGTSPNPAPAWIEFKDLEIEA